MRDLLYHYTTEAGLTGIVGSDRIRATHIRFLNDWTEFREAFTESYVRRLLDSFRASLPADLPAEARLVIDGMISRRAAEILEIILASESANETFVCSFTSASPQETGDPGDRLSQWRGYASATQGFSLGFDKSLLTEAVEINNRKARARCQSPTQDHTEQTRRRSETRHCRRDLRCDTVGDVLGCAAHARKAELHLAQTILRVERRGTLAHCRAVGDEEVFHLVVPLLVSTRCHAVVGHVLIDAAPRPAARGSRCRTSCPGRRVSCRAEKTRLFLRFAGEYSRSTRHCSARMGPDLRPGRRPGRRPSGRSCR